MKIFTICFSFIVLSSCSTIYYNFWETLGREKRDLLKSEMLSADSSHTEVKEELEDSLHRIRSEYDFKEGSLEKTYDSLSADYEDISSRSNELSDNIDKSEDIANDLFSEWRKEALSLNKRKYRKDSLTKLKKTKISFNDTLSSMRHVEKNMRKILKQYKDQVTYIKHNLNAKVIGSLQLEMKSISSEMEKLIVQIDRSKSKAKKFISKL